MAQWDEYEMWLEKIEEVRVRAYPPTKTRPLLTRTLRKIEILVLIPDP